MTDATASAHAELRRMQRGDSDNDRSLERMWDEGFRCKLDGRSYTEARYDMLENVVLISRGDTIVTVLDATNEEIEVIENG